jgi:ATP-dependent DNA helicase RecQ
VASVSQSAVRYLRQALSDERAGFRPAQLEAIYDVVVKRKRLLLVQRTGWGKSIVYFISTRLLRDQGAGPTLLVSPLLALMRNQIQMARNIGVNAVTLNSTNREEWDTIEHSLRSDEADLLLISPERLANEEFRANVLPVIARRVGLFVVDEAHCISDWGHDFRPDYRRIARIIQALPRNIPVLGTTATANDRVIADIRDQLGDELDVRRGPIKRESLRLQNLSLPSQAARMAWIAENLDRLPGSGIIYTLTIRDAQNVAAWLQDQGHDAHAYWGALDNDRRVELEDALLRNEVKALIATSALGMGFDKPDLGFVIHFQRPASAIHYYQQIGRAGRALPEALAILLCGDEDETITTYFMDTAFPPHEHVDEILRALREADDGLTIGNLEQAVNLKRTQIDQVLRTLATEAPTPVTKIAGRWYATPVRYQPDTDRIERIYQLRQHEQQRMREYMESASCLMAFLEEELGVPEPTPCGRCAVCAGQPLVPVAAARERVAAAHRFLRGQSYEIEPRRQWAPPGIPELDWTGRIPDELRLEAGRCLSQWRDSGWGELVHQGKFTHGRFDQQLVDAAAELIREQWKPDPFPHWVACVPSLHRPSLVPDFAQRLARRLDLPFHPCIRRVRHTAEQKTMRNSYQLLRNVAGSFAVDSPPPAQPVLLVDDIVDSRWTLTVAGAQLREAGSGPVFPFALTRMIG